LALTLASGAFAQTGALEPGDLRLNSGEYYDLFSYETTSPVTLAIELTSESFDVYLILLDASNAVVAEFDDTEGFATDIRESVTLENPGSYTLVVTSAFAGETGRYSLRISETPVLGKGVKTPPPAGALSPAPAPAASSSSERQPGYVVGRVTMPAGNAIAVAGASVTVFIRGVSYQSGQNVSFAVSPNTDGSYAQRVPDGSYRVAAQIEVTFLGERFRLDLQPNGPRVGDRDSAPGIVQDFIWFVQGRRQDADAGTADPFDYFGAYATMRFNFYRDDIGRSVEAGPPGTRILFTLTPLGPRIDGQPAETLTYELAYDALGSDTLLDIPIAPYSVTGIEITPDGRNTPLLMRVGFGQYAPSLELRFTPASYGGAGASAALLGFTRNVP
jgi:hypothetical protein